jgi:hypothetical protein
VLALTPDNIKLVWDEVAYQVEAGFVQMVPEEEMFAHGYPTNIKVSRLAVVPQRNCRGQLILNLSAGVELPPKRIPGSQRKQKRVQASVNDTTLLAENQEVVKRLGSTMADALLFQFESPCNWEVWWSKIDLSDGFWQMIVQAGQENNFVYKLPGHPKHPRKWFVVPLALQMGWKNSPAFFCATTEATQQIVVRLPQQERSPLMCMRTTVLTKVWGLFLSTTDFSNFLIRNADVIVNVKFILMEDTKTHSFS